MPATSPARTAAPTFAKSSTASSGSHDPHGQQAGSGLGRTTHGCRHPRRESGPAPDPQLLDPLVAAAVGIDDDAGDTIVVESIAFDELPDTEDLEARRSLKQQAAAWSP